MRYKYVSIPSDNSFDRSTPIYGVKVDLSNVGGGFSVDYFAYNFDLSAPSPSSNFYQSGDERGDFVIKVWSLYVMNHNANAQVKNKDDICTYFNIDTSVSSVFNTVSTDVYEISFCEVLYLRNVGYFNSTIDEARARDRIQFLVEDPSTIEVAASKTSLANTGETISISVDCENAWTVTGNTFLTLSSTGDTGSTTITATAPSYSGATARTDTLTFTDSVTGDEAEITIRQKKYSLGQPVYLGANEVTELYLGETAITEAYLGDVQVYSSGPFMGLKLSPKSFSFNSGSLTGACKVKSSEPWTMVVPAWLTASTLTGDTGETIVSLETTTSAITAGTITVTSANYSASASVSYISIDYGDIVVYKISDDTLYTTNPSTYSQLGNDYVPVGVCINPNGLIMSLTWMDKDNPDTGNLTKPETGVEWGPRADIVSNVTTTTDLSVAANDFNGRANTDAVLLCATAQTDWKSAQTIDFHGSYDTVDYYYPLFECAWRYHTSGTSQGDWYIPSVGEIKDAIDNHLTEINNSFQLIGGSQIYELISTSTQANGNNYWAYNFSRNYYDLGWTYGAKCFYVFWGWFGAGRAVYDASSVLPLPSE